MLPCCGNFDSAGVGFFRVPVKLAVYEMSIDIPFRVAIHDRSRSTLTARLEQATKADMEVILVSTP